jgi:hypothetical protein
MRTFRFGLPGLLAAVAQITCIAIPLAASPAKADTDFLRSLDGRWNGGGMVLTKINGKRVNIDCDFDMGGQGASLTMSGSCKTLLVVRRNIAASLKASGNRYDGTYVGPSGQPSNLSGSQRGNAINLDVHWAHLTNGDRSAVMTIEKMGDNRLRLQTIDKDLTSGKQIVTTRIDLTR